MILTVILSISIISCSRQQRTIPTQKINQDNLKQQYLEILNRQYPAEFKITQRIVLFTRGKQYDFTGYLIMKKSKSFRAVSLGDFGVKIFDFLQKDDKCYIISKPDTLPPNPLIDGVMGDIRHIFDFRPQEKCYLAERDDNQIGLINPIDEKSYEEYLFLKNDFNLIRSFFVSGKKIVSEIEYSNYQKFSDDQLFLPQLIVIHNYKWHYKIEVELLKIEPSIQPERLFQAP